MVMSQRSPHPITPGRLCRMPWKREGEGETTYPGHPLGLGDPTCRRISFGVYRVAAMVSDMSDERWEHPVMTYSSTTPVEGPCQQKCRIELCPSKQ